MVQAVNFTECFTYLQSKIKLLPQRDLNPNPLAEPDHTSVPPTEVSNITGVGEATGAIDLSLFIDGHGDNRKLYSSEPAKISVQYPFNYDTESQAAEKASVNLLVSEGATVACENCFAYFTAEVEMKIK